MRKRFAACFLTAFFATALALSLPVHAADGVTRTYHSDYSYGESYQVGDLAVVTQSERPIHVRIEKETLEGVILFYDETLNGAGTYHFILDYCEYDYEDTDPAAEYMDSYTVTINDVADSRSAYTMEDILVPDPGAGTDASSASYTLKVSLLERDARDAHQTGEAVVEDGVLRGSYSIDIDYLNYTMGDVDADSTVSVEDARLCLLYYAAQASDTVWLFSNEVHKQSENDCFAAADTNLDETIDVEDARRILVYYARQSVGETPDWDEIS